MTRSIFFCHLSHVSRSCILQITIWFSSISFHAYADISFESTSDVSLLFFCDTCHVGRSE